MTTWGALEVDADDAMREVLEHTVVASLAAISARFRGTRDHLAVAWITAVRPAAQRDSAEPSAFLNWMSNVDGVLRAHGAAPRWHGPASFVWEIDAPDRRSAAATTAAVLAAAGRAPVLRCGVAHASEVDDPGDLLRLAAYRAEQAEDAVPPMASLTCALSSGENARLTLISQNRERDQDCLVREALDLLSGRYHAD